MERLNSFPCLKRRYNFKTRRVYLFEDEKNNVNKKFKSLGYPKLVFKFCLSSK